MGGVRVNKDGEAYGLAGLYAVGEAACWDMHGFNRLGGNSLSETLVAGRVVGGRVAEYASGTTLRANTAQAFDALAAAKKDASVWLTREGNGRSVYEIRDSLGEIMITKVGIFRNGPDLESAVHEIQTLIDECSHGVLRHKGPGANPELAFALRLPGMLKLAMTVAMGALARSESRGAHFRTDFPLRNDREWLNRTLARWQPDASAPTLSYEPVGLIDLPPGHRGYGSDERIEMNGSVNDYNTGVIEAQQREGRLASVDPMGSRLHRSDGEAK
jgi:fumarate reductase flavoprotein subunit